MTPSNNLTDDDSWVCVESLEPSEVVERPGFLTLAYPVKHRAWTPVERAAPEANKRNTVSAVALNLDAFWDV